MDTLDGYIQLRDKVFEQILPLLDSDEIPAEDRFELSLQAAQLRGSLDLYERAFRAAQSLSSQQKMSAFMNLLGDIDTEIQERSSVVEGEQSQNPTPATNQESQG